jgi:hypothetical protein
MWTFGTKRLSVAWRMVVGPLRETAHLAHRLIFFQADRFGPRRARAMQPAGEKRLEFA